MSSCQNVSLTDERPSAKKPGIRVQRVSVSNQCNPRPGVHLRWQSTHDSAVSCIRHSTAIPFEGGQNARDSRCRSWSGKDCSRKWCLRICIGRRSGINGRRRPWREINRGKGLRITPRITAGRSLRGCIYNGGKRGARQRTRAKGEEVERGDSGCLESGRRTADHHVEPVVATDWVLQVRDNICVSILIVLHYHLQHRVASPEVRAVSRHPFWGVAIFSWREKGLYQKYQRMELQKITSDWIN